MMFAAHLYDGNHRDISTHGDFRIKPPGRETWPTVVSKIHIRFVRTALCTHWCVWSWLRFQWVVLNVLAFWDLFQEHALVTYRLASWDFATQVSSYFSALA